MNETFVITGRVKKINKFELWRESAKMHYYDIDAWEIECEKSTIAVFPEYLSSGNVDRFIELVKKDYFLGKKLKFFCFKKKEDNDTNYLKWVEEVKERKKDSTPPQIQAKDRTSLIENELEKEEEEKNELSEGSEQSGKKLFEIIRLQKEIIELLEQIGEKDNSEQKSEELKEKINQLKKEYKQKKQKLEELEKQLNYREEIIFK